MKPLTDRLRWMALGSVLTLGTTMAVQAHLGRGPETHQEPAESAPDDPGHDRALCDDPDHLCGEPGAEDPLSGGDDAIIGSGSCDCFYPPPDGLGGNPSSATEVDPCAHCSPPSRP
jgi:hypothetical protein